MIYDFSKICRTCLLEESELYNLFVSNELTIDNPFDILLSCTKIKIVENDEFPHQICKQCLYQANQAFLFQNQCEKSEATLKSYISRIKKDSNFINSSCVKIEIDQSKDSLQSNGSCSLPNETSEMGIKQETYPSESDTELNIHSKPRKVRNLTSELKCDTCDKTFKYANCHAKHMLIHTLKLQKVKDKKARKKLVKKLVNRTRFGKSNTSNTSCRFSENSIEKVKFKSNTSIPENVLKIEICDSALSTEEVKHGLNELDIDSKDPLLCKLCGKSFHRIANLRRHLILHQGHRSHLCNVCGKAFAQSAYLRIHMRTHSTERPHTCNICSSSFKQRSSLNVHYLTHTNIRAHVCNICGKSFKWNAVLKTHMMSHTDERKYECSVCGTKFKVSKHLTRHILTHTGEKKHVCPTCGKCFNRASNLRVHYKIHTGEKPHACTVCERAFLYKHCLQNHMKTHEC